MSNIDLQGLIDKVLSMAQASINSRGNPDYWSKPSWDQLKEENYWTEIRKRNTQLAVDKQKGGFDLEKQERANTGQLENTRETNAGELARKQLGIDFNREELEFNKRKFDSENIRDYYKTYVGAQSAKYTGSAELIKAASARANDTTLLPEQRQEAIDFLNNQYSMANKEAKQARQGLVDEQPAPAAAIPAPATPAATPTAVAKRPAPTYDDGKDVTPSIFNESKNNFDLVSPILQSTQKAPPPKSLQQQDADYFRRNKSAAGVVINPMLSPGESARMRMEQDKINAASVETEEQKKKKQKERRDAMGGWI